MPYLSCRDYAISGEVFDLHRCRNCGMIVTQEAPDEQHIGRYYQSESYISHSDTRRGMVNRLYHLARQIMLRRKRRLVEGMLPAHARTLL
ncbi:MAG: methyltransferase, partial [Calditrichaeota bacterium]